MVVDPIAPAPRSISVAVGVVTMLPCALFALLVPGAYHDIDSTSWRLVCVALLGTASLFFGTISYRLILNRPDRRGGLLSPIFLYGFAVGTAVMALIGIWIALQERSIAPFRTGASMLALGIPAFLLASRRRRADGQRERATGSGCL